ncbi:hypothetical protein BDR07DRAFT_1460876 [Suillus spraguei]|nr:hypothetical protein BDR07DRAFT_1460876 [Suillus spraguei]
MSKSKQSTTPKTIKHIPKIRKKKANVPAPDVGDSDSDKTPNLSEDSTQRRQKDNLEENYDRQPGRCSRACDSTFVANKNTLGLEVGDLGLRDSLRTIFCTALELVSRGLSPARGAGEA